MTIAQLRTRDLRGGPTPLVIDLDPVEVERNKAQQVYRLNVVQIPTSHILDFCLLSICLFFHNLPTSKSFSWLMLCLWFKKTNNVDISFIFIVFDIFIWTLVIYFREGRRVYCPALW
jgi:hypothetical protein